MRQVVEPRFIIDFEEQINCLEICTTDFAYNLMCIAAKNKLILTIVTLPEDVAQDFEYEIVKKIYYEKRCHAIAFAPDTSLIMAPKQVTFCVASSDFVLSIYRTDLVNADTVQPITGHKSYINDVAWSTDGEFLGSVSDDFSCKIWSSDSNYDVVVTFCLSSAGMTIKWHPDDPNKVMVAEKKGTIRLYNVRSQQALVSVEAPKGPLMSADWSINNKLLITAMAGGDICTWDIRNPVSPKDVKQVHEDGGKTVKFSPSATDLAIASVGRPDNTLKVFTAKATVPLLEVPLRLYGGMTWHPRFPCVIVADDRKLYFYKVQVK